MATTKIWAIKDSVERVLNYAANPEKTVDSDLINAINYAENEAKTENRCYVTGVNCNAETAFEEMKAVQERFGKTSGNVAYHAYQSFKTGEITPELCHKIGIELAKKMWGNDYQVLVATHLNTGTLHNHFVINSVNMWSGKKFDCNEGAYWKLRALSDELCTEHRLTVIKNPSGKTPRSIYFAEKNGKPTTFNLMKEAIDFGIEHCYGISDFKRVMMNQGYVVDINPRHKYWTIRSEYSKKCVRMYRLGEDYSNEAILCRIRKQELYGLKNALKYDEQRLQMRRFQPRAFVFRGSFKKLRSIGGLYAKYLHYLYLMGKLPKWNQRKPLSPEMREAWRYLDRISQQISLLSNKKLNTLEDVEGFIKDTEKSINQVADFRTKIYNKLRRCTDEDKRNELLSKRDDCTETLKQLRREKKIAITIIEDNPRINENISTEMQAQNLARGRKSNYRKKEYER